MQILSALSLQLAMQGESITDSGSEKKGDYAVKARPP